MVTITATQSGFHILSGLSTALAPNVFLRNGSNPDGTMVRTDAGWISRDTLHPDTARITGLADDPTATGQDRGEITFTGLSFTREGPPPDTGTTDADTAEPGATHIGTITFDTPLTVAATRSPDGPGDRLIWQADLGLALQAAVQSEGLLFEGGAGADVFDPAMTILPIRGPQILLGRGGDDQLHAGRADATLRGGTGDDLLTALGTAEIWGGSGADRVQVGLYSAGSSVYGGRDADWLTSSNGADMLAGNQGRDRIEGGRGDDHLRGGMDNDTLAGDDGADILRGGPGSDVLSGGADADRFIFRVGQTGHDTITDFDTEDLLVLHALTDAGALRQDWHGDDLVITWGQHDASITLAHFRQDALAEDQFVF